MTRPGRSVSWLVPAAALMLATMPGWFGVDLRLPAPIARELKLLVVSEAPKLPEPVVLAPVAPVDPPRPQAVVELYQPPAPLKAPKPRTIPSVAVAGVGLQGLTMRSEPGGGERIRLVDEGTDLRDLGEEREAGGRYWKHVRHSDGATGWVAAEFLVAWDGVDRNARTMKLISRSAGVESSIGLDRSWMQAPPELRSITPDQLKDGQTLSSWEAYAACGPAASVAFARAVGHEMTLDQATAAARLVGWSAAYGMQGPKSELALLASLGIEAHQRGESEDTIEWDRVIGDVQAGVPVMLVTPRHYYVAEGYDAATGKFDFGNSAMVLAAAGKQRWFTPDEVAWLGYGTPFTTIHLGQGPQPSEYLRAENSAY
jgi:hypothetical protein